MVNQDWPALVQSLRRALLLSREQFGTRLGVSSSQVYRWEKGLSVPRGRSQKALRALAGEEAAA